LDEKFNNLEKKFKTWMRNPTERFWEKKKRNLGNEKLNKASKKLNGKHHQAEERISGNQRQGLGIITFREQ
jgi:hypothetical protein